MRLIDADDLIEHFRWSEVARLSYNEIKKIIDDEDTIKPCENCDLYFKAMTKEEMKKGEWKELSDKYFHACSICNKVIFKNSFDNFCPSCGADMKKGGAENDL